MGKAYKRAHPNEPYDLSDPAGIAEELAQEAMSDAKEVASDVADTVSENMDDARESIKRAAVDAY